jgi:hypothetical protein
MSISGGMLLAPADAAWADPFITRPDAGVATISSSFLRSITVPIPASWAPA